MPLTFDYASFPALKPVVGRGPFTKDGCEREPISVSASAILPLLLATSLESALRFLEKGQLKGGGSFHRGRTRSQRMRLRKPRPSPAHDFCGEAILAISKCHFGVGEIYHRRCFGQATSKLRCESRYGSNSTAANKRRVRPFESGLRHLLESEAFDYLCRAVPSLRFEAIFDRCFGEAAPIRAQLKLRIQKVAHKGMELRIDFARQQPTAAALFDHVGALFAEPTPQLRRRKVGAGATRPSN